MGFNAESVDFSNFTPVLADYGPRDIHAVAAMVTNHNIGQWALEFEKDLYHDEVGMPYFKFNAERTGETDIQLKVEIGIWLVKVWNELHIFKDGMFQKTFTVPKEQLLAVKKAYRDKELELEREWQEEKDAEYRELEAEQEKKFEAAQASGDWSNLSKGEKMLLRHRLMEDEEFKAIVEAARLRKASKKLYDDAMEQGTKILKPVGDTVEPKKFKPASETSMGEREQIVQKMRLEGDLDDPVGRYEVVENPYGVKGNPVETQD